MATQVLTDCTFWVGEYDLSGDMNALAIDYGVNRLDGTTFGDDTEIGEGGLKQVEMSHEGLVNLGAGNADEVLFGQVGAADRPVAISPVDGSRGDVSYFLKPVTSEYTPQGAVGELYRFSYAAQGAASQPLVNGVVEHAKGAETASGTSTGVQLAAVGADESLYAALHVFANSGDGSQTLDVKIQSDDGSGFPSPVDQITFSQVTTTNTSELGSAAGAITDDWFRVNWTIGGTGSPSFTFAVVIGIE